MASDIEDSSKRRARTFSEFEPEPPSSKRQRGNTPFTSPDSLRRERNRDEAANHEPNSVVHSGLLVPDAISNVDDVDSLRIGLISYQSISKPYSVLPNEVKTVVFRWMRKYDQVTLGSQTPIARRLSMDLFQALGFFDPSKEEQLRDICVEKTKRLVYTKGRTFNGIQYTQDREGKRTWAPWTAAWLGEDWDGDIRPPNRKRRFVPRGYIQDLGENRDAQRSEGLSDGEVRGHEPQAPHVDAEHLRIGRITWSDISKPAPYYFPHEVKVAILRWMRRQENSPMGFQRHTLWSALGFLDESKDPRLREKCQEKAKTFIQNQAVYFKGKQYTLDEKGNRIWAPWTAAWLDDIWDGNTNPPPSPSSTSGPKPQLAPVIHSEGPPHDMSKSVKTEPEPTPLTPPVVGSGSVNLGTRPSITGTNESNNISVFRGSDKTGGEPSSMAGSIERGPLAGSRHSFGGDEMPKRRASIRRSLQDSIPDNSGTGRESVSLFSGLSTQHNSSDICHGLPIPERQPLGHIIDLSNTPQRRATRTPANSHPMSPADEHKAPSPQPVRKSSMLPTPNRSQPPQDSTAQPRLRPYADCHQVIASHLFSLKWEECRALIRLLETSPWNPDIA